MENNRNNTYEKPWKEPQTNHSNGSFYCIFRVGTRFKTIGQIMTFQRHMEREMEVPNADKSIENERIIGSKNVVEDVKEYIKDAKTRKNGVLATELLLTATHDFFSTSDKVVDQWVTLNKEWLQYEFKDNCIYSILHKDEYTCHIHALIVPKWKTENGYSLSNRKYFAGKKTILRDWQDRYYEHMKVLGLQRGIKGSKAKHLDIQKFYGLINQNYNELSKEQLIAKAKELELLKMKNKALTKTLDSYKKQLSAEKNKSNILALEDKKEVKNEHKLERVR